ncbi:hypothetical protein ACWKT3_00295 [Streptomyces violaceus]
MGSGPALIGYDSTTSSTIVWSTALSRPHAWTRSRYEPGPWDASEGRSDWHEISAISSQPETGSGPLGVRLDRDVDFSGVDPGGHLDGSAVG